MHHASAIATKLNLSLVSLSGSRTEASLCDIYTSAYSLWQSQWSSVLKETRGLGQLFADNFTRQDEVMALVAGSECIAICCHRIVEMRNQAHKDDSYFVEWPKQVVNKLAQDYSGPMVIASQLAIRSDFRRAATGSMVSQVMVYLTLKKMKRLPISGVIVSARTLRGMSALCETCNPLKIAEVEMNREPSALYVYEPHLISFSKLNPEVIDLGEFLLEQERVSKFMSPFFKPIRQGENNIHAA